jgi:hypothetical protein
MNLTKKAFDEFINRLKFHNIGKGVKDHGTRSPLFLVQQLVREYGIGKEYCEKWAIVDGHFEAEFDSVEDLFDCIDEDEIKAIIGNHTIEDFLGLSSDCQLAALEANEYSKHYYIEKWKYVNCHLTKEAAEFFIEEHKWSYKELRISVDSLCRSPEFEMIINGLISGKIGFIEELDRINTEMAKVNIESRPNFIKMLVSGALKQVEKDGFFKFLYDNNVKL